MNFFDIFSIHFWRALRLEFFAFARFYKSVEAADLEELCGYINPPYSRLLEMVEQGKGDISRLREAAVVRLFYENRMAFLEKDHLLNLITSQFVPESVMISLYEELRETFSPTSEKFMGLVEEMRLKDHVALRNNGIEFRRIKVNGEVNFSLGWGPRYCAFNHVKFCNDVTVDMHSPLEIFQGNVLFNKSICREKCSCSFSLSADITFIQSVFRSSVQVMCGMEPKQRRDRYSVEFSPNIQRAANDGLGATVVFFDNYVKDEVSLHDFSALSGNIPNIDMVRLINRNVVGGLSVPPVLSAEEPPVEFCEYPHTHRNHIGNIDFGIDEVIQCPSEKKVAERYKNAFLALKNRARKKCDREGEFKYGRQERYFDWCLSNGFQDSFIFWWSRVLSNSGISWARPVCILLLGQLYLAFAYIGEHGECGNWLTWLQAAIDSLNPLSNLSDIIKSSCCEEGWGDSLSASVYNAVRRIFSLVLIYEIIKALRRFHN